MSVLLGSFSRAAADSMTRRVVLEPQCVGAREEVSVSLRPDASSFPGSGRYRSSFGIYRSLCAPSQHKEAYGE